MIRSRRIDRNAGFPLQRIAQAAMVSRRHQNSYRSPRLKAEVSGSPHKSASNGSITTMAGPPAPISNRNTKLLEFPLSHRKQSPVEFLIATFRAFFPPDATRIARQRIARLRIARERPANAGQLSAIRGPRRSESRPSRARKLENRTTRLYSATSKFLIDNFHRHFQSFVPTILRKRPPQPELHRASKVTSILISKRQEDS